MTTLLPIDSTRTSNLWTDKFQSMSHKANRHKRIILDSVAPKGTLKRYFLVDIVPIAIKAMSAIALCYAGLHTICWANEKVGHLVLDSENKHSSYHTQRPTDAWLNDQIIGFATISAACVGMAAVAVLSIAAGLGLHETYKKTHADYLVWQKQQQAEANQTGYRPVVLDKIVPKASLRRFVLTDTIPKVTKLTTTMGVFCAGIYAVDWANHKIAHLPFLMGTDKRHMDIHAGSDSFILSSVEQILGLGVAFSACMGLFGVLCFTKFCIEGSYELYIAKHRQYLEWRQQQRLEIDLEAAKKV